MSDHIWIVRDPQGAMIGVGFNPINALFNVVPNSDLDTLQRFRVAIEQTGEDELHHMGYTLTREPLTPAPRVVVLDEWRVYMKCGSLVDGADQCESEMQARSIAERMDLRFQQNAPHRVVRVALVSEEDFTEAPADGA